MLFNRMFRERALDHRARQEPLDDRLQITAPHEWLIVAGLGLMLLVLITYGVFVRVERTASYDAVSGPSRGAPLSWLPRCPAPWWTFSWK